MRAQQTKASQDLPSLSETKTDIDSPDRITGRHELKQNGLEGVAYAAHLLLRLKEPTRPASAVAMPMSNVHDSTFSAGAGIARKRGLPYARNELDTSSPHLAQALAGVNANGGSFYISGPRPARLFPTPMHEFRKGKYATTGGDRGFMTGE